MRALTAFLGGTIAGLVSSSVVYFVSFITNSIVSDTFVSGVTLTGMALAIAGYLAQRRGIRSPSAYFMFGLGVGIVIVAFVGVGSGVSPYIGS